MGIREGSSSARSWPSFLRGENPGANLERLSHGDPLHLCEGVARRLRERWVLLDPDRTFHRALAVCAHAAAVEEVPEDLVAWAGRKIDEAIDRLVEEDRKTEKERPDLLSDEEQDFPLLTECLMLDPRLVRSVSVAFNALDGLPRRAFFELLVEGRELNSVIESGPWNADGLYEAVHLALKALTFDGPMDGAQDARKRKKGKT